MRAGRRGCPERIQSYSGPLGSFGAWLRPFVRHELGDLRRQRIDPADLELVYVQPPTKEETRDKDSDELGCLLLQLPLTDQLIIALRDYEGLTYAQCAERLGNVSAGACRVRHHRAVQRLRALALQDPAFAHYQGG